MHVSTPVVDVKAGILRDLMDILPGELAQVLRTASVLASQQNRPLYAVGGVIRDAILKRPSLDLDLMIEAPSPSTLPGKDPFLIALNDALNADLLIHDTFRTAVLRLPSGLHIDVAQAREETYDHPASLPDVHPGTFEADLHRRDFTINAMALRLDGPGAGSLMDPTGGLADLESGQLRLLHAVSFRDDPTRLFRGLRFLARLQFDWSPETEQAARIAFAEGYPALLSPQRLGHELDLLAQEPSFPGALISLEHLGGMGSFGLGSLQDTGVLGVLSALWTEPPPKWIRSLGAAHGPSGAVLLGLLRSVAPKERVKVLKEWAILGGRQRQMMEECLQLEALQSMDLCAAKLSTLIAPLRKLGESGWRLLWAGSDEAERGRLAGLKGPFLAQAPLDGRDLIKIGVKPGPGLGELLAQMNAAFLDGEFQDKAGGISFVKNRLGVDS